MKLYLIERKKASSTYTLLCANYHTVLDALASLDGTDESIRIEFTSVADSFSDSKTNPKM